MIKERLHSLRELMKKNNVDAYLILTDDFHGSEYVGDYFKCREYISGFTGSAGTLVVLKNEAGLFTDGRYFLQAEEQLKDTTITLYKMGEEGVPTVSEFIEEKLNDGETLGFDGRTVGYEFAKSLEEKLAAKNVSIKYELDLVDEVWTDRPELSKEPVMFLGVEYVGKSREDKIADIRKAMEEKKADYFVLTTLDDIAWALNIRGNDVCCNPVLLSYAVFKQDEILLFAAEEDFTAEQVKELETDGIRIYPYNDVYEYIKKIPEGKSVLVNGKKTNYAIMMNIADGVEVINEENVTFLPKAIKNATEVENERIAHVKDGVAMVKFIHYLKTRVGKEKITELSAAEELEKFRGEQEHYMGPSFEPIIGFAEHGAIVHYSATEDSDVTLEPRSLVLCDTGGQYLEGTTDITRTVALGPVDDDMKRHFTAVLRGNLNLGACKFLYGCRGINFDYVARKPLWDMGLDYNHGTGHGVGYFLNVHEGPNGFRWRIVPERNDSAVFEEGMITSNEPGLYITNKYGIRCENLMVCVKDEKTDYGQFMRFDTLTMVPFDLDAIAPEYMNDYEKKLLNDYHKKVYETISPYLDDELKEWLKDATREI